jgi:hypothetical protein
MGQGDSGGRHQGGMSLIGNRSRTRGPLPRRPGRRLRLVASASEAIGNAAVRAGRRRADRRRAAADRPRLRTCRPPALNGGRSPSRPNCCRNTTCGCCNSHAKRGTEPRLPARSSIPHGEGGLRSRPCIAIERDSRLAVARLVRELDLDTEPPPSDRSAEHRQLRNVRKATHGY